MLRSHTIAAGQQGRASDKQQASHKRLKAMLAAPDIADLLASERDLRVAHQEAERLRHQNHELQQALHAYEKQRQDALSALEAYQQQVQRSEQQMQQQMQGLLMQVKEQGASLKQLQEEHSACAATEAAGLQAAQERDELRQELSSTQAHVQVLQQQLAQARAHASSTHAATQPQQQGPAWEQQQAEVSPAPAPTLTVGAASRSRLGGSPAAPGRAAAAGRGSVTAAGRVQKREQHGRGGRSSVKSVLLAPAEWLKGVVHKLGGSAAGGADEAPAPALT